MNSNETRIVIHPSLENVRLHSPGLASLAGAVPLLGLGTAMFVKAAGHEPSFVWLGGGIIVGVLALVILAVGVGEWLVSRNMTLFVGDSTFGMTNLWGSTTTSRLEILQCVELASEARTAGGQKVRPAFARFVSIDGATIFEIRGKEFCMADLRRLCDEACVPLVGSWDKGQERPG